MKTLPSRNGMHIKSWARFTYTRLGGRSHQRRQRSRTNPTGPFRGLPLARRNLVLVPGSCDRLGGAGQDEGGEAGLKPWRPRRRTWSAVPSMNQRCRREARYPDEPKAGKLLGDRGYRRISQQTALTVARTPGVDRARDSLATLLATICAA